MKIRAPFHQSPSMLNRLRLLTGFILLLRTDALSEDRPNILWITCEDMSPRLGCYGDKFAITPNIDALARQSVRYTRAFATAPACSPSRACLITGMYATSLGNPHLRTEITIPPSIKSYALHFREAGYFTSNNVKTDYNLRNEPAFNAAAWNQCDKDAHWRGSAKGDSFFSVFNLTETHQSRTNVWPWEEFEKQIGSRLSQGTRAHPDDVPLPPYYPDTPLARRTMARLYDCIQAMDDRVGQILRQLEEDDLAANTIVFFYSDHGDGVPRGKRTLYDSGLHVPLLIRFPEKWQHLAPGKPGTISDRMVSFVDFAPTVLSLAGLPVPKHMQGVPFLGKAAGPARNAVFGARDRVDEAFELSRSVRDGRWLYIRNYLPHISWMQPEGYSDHGDFRRELVELAGRGKLSGGPQTYTAPRKATEELYDTEADPHQLRNLAGIPEHAARVRGMGERLRSWILETRDLGFIPEAVLWEIKSDLSPMEFAADPQRYPLAKILAAAEMIGSTAPASEIHTLITDPEPAVRYWGAIAFQSQANLGELERGALADALKSETSLPVRTQLAAALLNASGSSAAEREVALSELQRAVANPDETVVLEAVRALELAGENARPALPMIKQAWEKVRTLPANRFRALYIRFSTEATLRKLGEEIPRQPMI
jgi:N-sulfoglucosamine sulfohydrolase